VPEAILRAAWQTDVDGASPALILDIMSRFDLPFECAYRRDLSIGELKTFTTLRPAIVYVTILRTVKNETFSLRSALLTLRLCG
jgi:hypothetical protein